MKETCELAASELRYTCDPTVFKFKNTAEIEPLDEVIGQERAVHAIDFGLNMTSPGYNIFVTGIEGTGRTTIVRDITAKHAQSLPTPRDWCMVNNFHDEYRPKAMPVPSGSAVLFSKQMNRLIHMLKNKLPKAFERSSFQEKSAQVQEAFQAQEKALFQQLEQSAKDKKLVINKASSGYQTIPVQDGKPMAQEAFQALPEQEQKKLKTDMQVLQGELETTLREINKIRQSMSKAMEKLMEETALFVVKDRMEYLKETYGDCDEIQAYLDEVQADIIENVEEFLPSQEPANQTPDMLFPAAKPPSNKYMVNVIADRRKVKGAPVVFEPNPTYHNVFGQIEKKAHMGGLTTDFTLVKSGSLLQADGGFLIMEIESLLMNPVVWEALKRALQNKLLFIEDISSAHGYATSSLRPEPIPLEVKVILIGGYQPFEVLQNYDSKFNKIFKVRADFDHEVERSDIAIQQYARFVARVCQQENLLPLTAKGVASLVEFGEKYTSNKNKLSIRFGPIVGIIKEANYWAGKDNAEEVSDIHVVKAFNEHRFRYNLYEEKIHESYLDGTILIDIDKAVVGQVNALAVYQMGDISFGRPSRITAETYMGKAGVVNIEREANMSGKTHDKGVMILSGFLGRTFAQNIPLNLSISITFEQSYSGIDGDSASSTELYAILSSLSGFPIDQGTAVTGSVNQKGSIQAIGGANQKIEGFFDVCKTRGLTGNQGVMIPKANVKNLMLKKEVVDAVEQGKFHIYQVATIEDGIQILTGQEAGSPDAKGDYPEGTVFGNVQKKLQSYYEKEIQIKKALADS